jgi:hypothetical protein
MSNIGYIDNVRSRLTITSPIVKFLWDVITTYLNEIKSVMEYHNKIHLLFLEGF